jgi:hypothetical protein
MDVPINGSEVMKYVKAASIPGSTGVPYGYCAIAISTNGQPLRYLSLPTEPQEKRRYSHHAGRLTVFVELRKMIRPIDLTNS